MPCSTCSAPDVTHAAAAVGASGRRCDTGRKEKQLLSAPGRHVPIVLAATAVCSAVAAGGPVAVGADCRCCAALSPQLQAAFSSSAAIHACPPLLLPTPAILSHPWPGQPSCLTCPPTSQPPCPPVPRPPCPPCSEQTTEENRAAFEDFVEAWNMRRLPAGLYAMGEESAGLGTRGGAAGAGAAPRTSFNWGIKGGWVCLGGFVGGWVGGGGVRGCGACKVG